MDAILRLYDNVAALKALSGQLNDDKQGGLAHMLELLALDIEVCGEALEAKEFVIRKHNASGDGSETSYGVNTKSGACVVVTIDEDDEATVNVFKSHNLDPDDTDADGDDVPPSDSQKDEIPF